MCRRTGLPGRLARFPNAADVLLSGTTFPDTINAYNPADPANPLQPVWAGEPGAQLDPLGLLQGLGQSLTQDPSQNPIRLPNVGDVASNLVKLGVDMITDFNPFITGSFLFWGAPTLYSVPAALAGLVQNFTGIPNQFVGIGAWQGNSTAGGGIPPGGENAGPLDLITGLPLGFAYLAQGLLGYLNPSTYLGATLGKTLLGTYAKGSLPGSDIASLLSGLGVGTLLNAGGIGGLLPSAPEPAAVQQTSINSVETTNEKKSFTLAVAPDQGDPKGDTAIDPGQVATTPTKLAETEHKGPILNFLTNNGNSATGSNTAVVGSGTGTGTGTNRPTPIKDAVSQAGNQLKKAADDLNGGLKDAADNVKKALGGDKANNDSGSATS